MGDEEHFFFNGVDATTGSYLLPPLPVDAVSKLARGEQLDGAHLDELRYRHARATEATFGPAEGVDPRDISDAGWGVILAAGAEDGVLEALRPLLEHRRRQATQRHERRYRQLTGEHAYRPGESKQEFLARNGAGPGPADPDRMPYYLLLVGDPEAIPYTFQYQLDVQYAVGRICFDTLDEYARYATAVVTAESTPASNTTTAAFFAPSNPHDPATALSASELVTPLADRLAADHPDWTVHRLIGEAADKPALVDLLGGDTTPSLLFTASHGAGFPPDHPAQRRRQGALICQEWGGPDAGICEDAYVSGEDIGSDASLRGLVAFHFACYGAGTPAWDDFGHRDGGPRRPLASQPFVAALPQRLLSHERGGALAIAGHVDRAWGYSFVWPGAGRQTEVFRSSVERLLTGHPIGSAFEYLNERYAELASDLSVALEDISYGKRPDHRALATMWTANNDARGFMVLGDPAVRMPVVATPPPDERETVAVSAASTIHVPPPPPRPEVRGAGAPASERPTEPAPRPVPGGPAPRPRDEDRDDPGEPVPASIPDLELDYGLREGLRQTGDRLAVAVQHLAETLAAAMERAAESVAVVEVATYTSDDPSGAVYDRTNKRFDGARLRALSRASVSGDLQLLVDEDDLLDERLWACHLAMVDQAQRTRTELFRSAGTVVTGMWDALRPGG
jgi:hypothetical protein